MNEFRARIGRVRMKAGGADVVVLGAERIEGDLASDFMEHARNMALESEPGSEITGYVMVTLFSDGAKAVGFDMSQESRIPRELLPAMIAELVRRKIVTQSEAIDVVNRANGYED